MGNEESTVQQEEPLIPQQNGPIVKKEEEIEDKIEEKIEERIEKKTNYEIDKPPIDVKERIEEYFHTSYPINISEDVFNTKNDLIKLRRYFHANPELSFAESETSKNILNYCDSLGLLTRSGIGSCSTGVCGVLHGGGGGNNNICIGLVVNIDGLAIQEENENNSYKSRIKNIMHACGNDCHMAILLTVARILSQPKYVNKINGIIKFIFQTSKDTKYIISNGILEEDKELNCPLIKQIYGLNVWSYNKLGKIILKSDILMAGNETFIINVIGIGGHGAQPLNTSDTVLAITSLNIQLHSIISRNISPISSGLITINKTEIGNSYNIIAENGYIKGTIRYLNTNIYNIIKKRIQQICKGIEISYNVNINIKWENDMNSYPPLINNKINVKYVENAVNKVFPNANKQNIIIKTQTTMAVQDFSAYLNKINNGCFFFIGCGVENKNKNKCHNEIYPHHTSKFKVDERCLLIGVQILVNLVMDLLAK